MAKLWPRFWAVPLALLSLGVADVLTPLRSTVYAQQSKSWTESITSPFKQGFDKLGRALNPNPKPSTSASGPDDDAVSLKTKSKPGTNLYVAIAHLYEQSGKTAEAELQYQLALKEKSDDLPALLGYAHLKDFLGKTSEAIQIYQQAIKAHPQEASVHNNLGMCYSRQDRLDEAVASMNRAVQLEPKNALYRNNLATLLVDQGKWREALTHLRAVHSEAAAYYNMGYLLTKKGQTQAAIQHFALALRADPSMDSAQRWVEHLQKSTAQARLPQNPATTGERVSDEPMETGSPRGGYRPGVSNGNLKPPSGSSQPAAAWDALVPPDEPAPRRLPPTTLHRPTVDGPALPGISYERSAAPAAPLPPPWTNSAIRPLPRVE